MTTLYIEYNDTDGLRLGLGHLDGADTNAERLGVEIEAVAEIVPTLQRLTEIIDPFDGTVLRLGQLSIA